MSRIFAVFLILLTGCSRDAETIFVNNGTQIGDEVSFIQSAAQVEMTWETLQPVVMTLCNENLQSDRQRLCRFAITVDDTSGLGPNAQSSMGPDGKTQISITRAMLQALESEEELAFVLGHEAAHTIAGHHDGLRVLQLSEGFALSRDGNPEIELEADVIGTFIVANAGFTAEGGVRLLSRLANLTSTHSHTHPDLDARKSIIERTYSVVQSGAQITLD